MVLGYGIMKTSPTQRSLRLLRERGYLVAVVERWNQYAMIRQDLWGFGDLLAVKDNEVLIVQTTSGANVAARLDKIATNDAAQMWRSGANRRVVVHGWRKVGGVGKRKLWECREVEVSDG